MVKNYSKKPDLMAAYFACSRIRLEKFNKWEAEFHSLKIS